MKKSFLLFLLTLNLFSLYSQEVEADTNQLVFKPWYEVITNKNVKYIAKIVSDDGREVLLDTKEIGKIYVNKSDIRSIKKIKDEKDVVYGEYRYDGPFTTRYSLTTNALPIKKGENYALIHLWGPEMHFAVSDHLSIGFMTSWLTSPFGVAVKRNFKTGNEKVNLSVGILAGTMGFWNSFAGNGLLGFGNVTIGSRMNNVTFSLGYSQFKSGYTMEYQSEVSLVEIDPVSNYVFTNSYTAHTSYKRPSSGAVLASVSGIARVSARVSFIVDAIFSSADVTRPPFVYTDTMYTNSPYVSEDINPADFINYRRNIFVLLPAMRFNSRDNFAFQLTLGSFHIFENSKRRSFPYPMCSWFLKF